MDKERWPVAKTCQYGLQSTLHLYAVKEVKHCLCEVTSLNNYCAYELFGIALLNAQYCTVIASAISASNPHDATMDQATHKMSVYAAAMYMLCCTVPYSIVCHMPKSFHKSLASIQTSPLRGMSLDPYHTHGHSKGPAFASVILPGT